MDRQYWNGDVGWRYQDSDGITYGITAESVKADLEALNGADLVVELSTWGGDFDQAARIYDMVRGYKGKKTLYLSANVASAGTLIAMAFPKASTFARATTRYMIHNAQGFAIGDHNDMREQADHFEKMSEMVAQLYADFSGKKLAEIKAMMDKETWFMGDEIVSEGFAGQMDDYGDAAGTMSALGTMAARMQAKSEFRARATMWANRPASAALDPVADLKAAAEALIAGGQVDKDSAWSLAQGDKVAGFEADSSKEGFKYPSGKNGKIYRSALRSIASRAAVDNPELSQWAAAMIKKIDAKGAKPVNKEEVIAWLKANPGVDLVELAKDAGRTIELATPEHVAALSVSRKLVADLKVTDAAVEIDSLRKTIADGEGKAVENELDAKFGKAKDADGQDNLLRAHAGTFFKDVKTTELEAKIELFKKDPIAMRLAGERADVNKIGFVEPGDKKNQVQKTYRGSAVREV